MLRARSDPLDPSPYSYSCLLPPTTYPLHPTSFLLPSCSFLLPPTPTSYLSPSPPLPRGCVGTGHHHHRRRGSPSSSAAGGGGGDPQAGCELGGPPAGKSPPRRAEAPQGRSRGPPPKSRGAPNRTSSRACKICSRIRAGNSIFPPVTSNLFDP